MQTETEVYYFHQIQPYTHQTSRKCNMEMIPQHLPTNIHSFVFTGSQKLKVSWLEKEPLISAGLLQWHLFSTCAVNCKSTWVETFSCFSQNSFCHIKTKLLPRLIFSFSSWKKSKCIHMEFIILLASTEIRKGWYGRYNQLPMYDVTVHPTQQTSKATA